MVRCRFVLLVACLTSQQHASVSQGRICSILRAATLRYKLQIKLSTSPSHSILTPGQPDPILPTAWQGCHWSANFLSHWYDSTLKKSWRKWDSNPGSSTLEADALTTRPTRRLWYRILRVNVAIVAVIIPVVIVIIIISVDGSIIIIIVVTAIIS